MSIRKSKYSDTVAKFPQKLGVAVTPGFTLALSTLGRVSQAPEDTYGQFFLCFYPHHLHYGRLTLTAIAYGTLNILG